MIRRTVSQMNIILKSQCLTQALALFFAERRKTYDFNKELFQETL